MVNNVKYEDFDMNNIVKLNIGNIMVTFEQNDDMLDNVHNCPIAAVHVYRVDENKALNDISNIIPGYNSELHYIEAFGSTLGYIDDFVRLWNQRFDDNATVTKDTRWLHFKKACDYFDKILEEHVNKGEIKYAFITRLDKRVMDYVLITKEDSDGNPLEGIQFNVHIGR